jgi:hypothetical protein
LHEYNVVALKIRAESEKLGGEVWTELLCIRKGGPAVGEGGQADKM